MSLLDDLNTQLKAAMKARDGQTKDLIRMLKSRVTERTTAPGFTGELNDALVLDVMATYAKQMRKAKVDYAKAGDSGAEAIESLTFEIEWIEPWLPTKLDADATKALVDRLADAMGISEKRDMGRLMGAIMKDHRDDVDANLVRQCVEDRLSA